MLRHPHHNLQLKIGSIGTLICNLNVMLGLVNGTRLKVVWMRDNYLELEVLPGSTKVFCLTSVSHLQTNVPFLLKRRQFLVKLHLTWRLTRAKYKLLTKSAFICRDSVFTVSGVHFENSVKIRIDNNRKVSLMENDHSPESLSHARCYNKINAQSSFISLSIY